MAKKITLPLNKKHIAIVLCFLLSQTAFCQIEPVAGVEYSMFTSFSNYGWELGAVYPFVAIQAWEALRLSAFGGAGVSIDNNWEGTATFDFGANFEVFPFGILLGVGYGYEYLVSDDQQGSYPFMRFALGIGDDVAYTKLYYDDHFNDNDWKVGLLFGIVFFPSSPQNTVPERRYVPPPPPPTPTPPPPSLPQNTVPEIRKPVITSEELTQLELAYAYNKTYRDIEAQGRRLSISSMYERNLFIQKYQGRPNDSQVASAINWKLESFKSSTVSAGEIVERVKNEPNEFRKVRLLHDWVTDVFAYEYQLLWLMDNVSGRNAEFTLQQIIDRERGVCLEYAVLFWFLADTVGMDAYLIADYSEPGIGHAYNMVVINETGYIIDTTWDSGYLDRSNNFRRDFGIKYFMPSISKSYMLRDW
jgi:hypothetical protein